MKKLLPLLLCLLNLLIVSVAMAAPGLCTGPICADNISRSAKNHWQLVLRLNDQQGHREKVVMDCKASVLSPRAGLVDRGFALALGKRACRLAGEEA
ncbi:hypothetical protein CWE17_04995 [Synechococcus sp. BS56D]|uniref:hypothetical protein n=1 Tax=Synechococcus sp. BS56D TaxID=2055944 RepID=UPI00103FF6F4|nr:hypothetical protein [Synechococcus sp. BS56D]TCD58474.1 hypothetical protein CWE17_04995 [Synechococcus sp. BS56D]